MKHKLNKSGHKFDGKSFLILPIIYLIVFYLVIFIAISPILSTVATFSGLFFSEKSKDYSLEYDNIYKPVTDENSLEIIKKNNKQYIDIESIEFPTYGDSFAKLIIKDCNINCNLFFGDGAVSLRNGVGMYSGSFIPGYGGTILISGHNNTYFNGLKNAEKNQIVTIKTSYGIYKYKITKIKIVNADDYTSSYNLGADKENLIMYTCYPFDEIGMTTFRYFVYAKKISGIPIDKSIKEEK